MFKWIFGRKREGHKATGSSSSSEYEQPKKHSKVKKLVPVESSSEDESIARKSDLRKSDKRLKIKKKQTESSSSDIESSSTSTDLKKQRSSISQRVSLHACIMGYSISVHLL